MTRKSCRSIPRLRWKNNSSQALRSTQKRRPGSGALFFIAAAFLLRLLFVLLVLTLLFFGRLLRLRSLLLLLLLRRTVLRSGLWARVLRRRLRPVVAWRRLIITRLIGPRLLRWTITIVLWRRSRPCVLRLLLGCRTVLRHRLVFLP